MNHPVFILAITFFLTSCASKIVNEDPSENKPDIKDHADLANVVSVSVSGEENGFQFSVGLRSPDEDCDQYANWWEVVSLDGELLYRRILTHSHPTEQPFVRTGGPVEILETEAVVIRGHMHPGGYGGVAYQGSVATGFQAVEKPASFASKLSESEPLPTVCTS